MITMVLVFIDDVAVVIDCNFLNNCCVVAVIIPIILTFYSVCKRGCKRVLILPIVTIIGSMVALPILSVDYFYSFIITNLLLIA